MIRIIRRVACTVFTLCVAASASTEVAAQATGAPAGWGAFTKIFDTAAAATASSGPAIVLVRDGRMVAHHELGFADRPSTGAARLRRPSTTTVRSPRR